MPKDELLESNERAIGVTLTSKDVNVKSNCIVASTRNSVAGTLHQIKSLDRCILLVTTLHDILLRS